MDRMPKQGKDARLVSENGVLQLLAADVECGHQNQNARQQDYQSTLETPEVHLMGACPILDCGGKTPL